MRTVRGRDLRDSFGKVMSIQQDLLRMPQLLTPSSSSEEITNACGCDPTGFLNSNITALRLSPREMRDFLAVASASHASSLSRDINSCTAKADQPQLVAKSICWSHNWRVVASNSRPWQLKVAKLMCDFVAPQLFCSMISCSNCSQFS